MVTYLLPFEVNHLIEAVELLETDLCVLFLGVTVESFEDTHHLPLSCVCVCVCVCVCARVMHIISCISVCMCVHSCACSECITCVCVCVCVCAQLYVCIVCSVSETCCDRLRQLSLYYGHYSWSQLY